MKNPVELVQHCRRQWWWSPEPFWRYHVSGQKGWSQGWANFIDLHPGLFNLAWRLSGVQGPPAHYPVHADTTIWVLDEARNFKVGGVPLPDAAFNLSWPQFKQGLLGQPDLCRRFRHALSA